MRHAAAIACLLPLAACATTPAAHPSTTPAATAPAPTPPPPATTTTAAPAAAPSPPERFAADTPRTTPSGARFVVPASWSLRSAGGPLVLEGPEPGLRVALVESQAKDAAQAVADAWPTLEPGFKRPLRIAQDRPAREGWEESRAFVYETSPDERLMLQAVALRKGTTWTVMLLDASEPALERRGAQVGLLAQSLRPGGYERESFAGKQAHPLDAARLKLLEDFAAEARALTDTPGVGIALLDGGKVVFAGGFGVRRLGTGDKVDGDTRFMIASNTKALTTLLLARLVDQGKLRWDEPVVDVYPTFQLGDAATTKQVLIKHLVCACTGLPRQDLEMIFEYGHLTPESSMHLLATMQPTTRFGEVFQYSNFMAGAAGFIAGHLLHPKLELGAAYDRAMQEQVFGPLGMRSTTLDVAAARKARDHASPHGEDVDGKTALVSDDLETMVQAMRPAGAAWSTPADVARYVQMELAKGVLPNGKRLLSEENLMARRAPQVGLGEDKSYGMGLMVDRSSGTTVVHHGGDLPGFHSDMFWLPEHGVGGVILTNADAGVMIRGPFVRRVLEVLFDGRPEAEEDLKSAVARHRAAQKKERERLTVPPDVAAVAALAAHYHSDGLGDLDVKRDGAQPIFDFGEWRSPVATRKNDDGSLSFITIAPALDGIELVVATRDGKRALVVRDGQHEYVFREAP